MINRLNGLQRRSAFGPRAEQHPERLMRRFRDHQLIQSVLSLAQKMRPLLCTGLHQGWASRDPRNSSRRAGYVASPSNRSTRRSTSSMRMSATERRGQPFAGAKAGYRF
jgi:hypothetical protein